MVISVARQDEGHMNRAVCCAHQHGILKTMSDTAVQIRLMVVILLAVAVPIVWLMPLVLQAQAGAGKLQVHFFDVGQGDSIFIETPDHVQVLVDGGRDSTVLRRLATYMSPFDHSINMIVRTHPDSDHIAGLIDVLHRFHVDTILTTENVSDTQTSHAFQAAEQASGAHVVMARTGQLYHLGASTTMRVLSPAVNPSQWDTNPSSIVTQIRYGSTTVLLTGDAPSTIEHQLVTVYGSGLHSDVFKPGHHGSRFSTSEEWLNAVTPIYAVISAGKNNRYGHPTKVVMDRLAAHHVTVYSTIDDGTVDFVSDGTTIRPAHPYALATTVGR